MEDNEKEIKYNEILGYHHKYPDEFWQIVPKKNKRDYSKHKKDFNSIRGFNKGPDKLEKQFCLLLKHNQYNYLYEKAKFLGISIGDMIRECLINNLNLPE